MPALSDLLMLTPAQMRRIEPCFPRSHGIPRVDDQRVLSGILFVIRNGLRWRDAPAGYGPHKPVLSLSKGRSTTGSSAGAGSVCSTASWPNWPGRAEVPTS